AVGCQPAQMLVCSTGVIGRHLPMPVVEKGIREAAAALQPSAQALDRAARAILTTDTDIKVSTRMLTLDGADVRVTGFAKGAAMIGPNLATMLAFVLTDAAVAPEDLRTLARRAADQTFNCVTVEGHTSTNDTLLFFANGTGPCLQNKALARVESDATTICLDLAQAIADDAGVPTHFVTITAHGLGSNVQTRKIPH